MIGKIYCLKHPISLEIRYVGQTRLTLEQRLYNHWRDRNQKKNKNNHNSCWIRKVEKETGLKPIISLLEEVHVDLLNIKETDWMRYYRSLGIDLTNTSGDYYFHSKRKSKENMFKKKVYAYKRDYSYTIYESARAADLSLGIGYKTISASCKGKFILGEYTFSFTEISNSEIDNKFFTKQICNCKIIATCVFTKKVLVFNTQKEGADYFKCNFRNISACLKGTRKSCCKHIWTTENAINRNLDLELKELQK